jgi:hypothetical protein
LVGVEEILNTPFNFFVLDFIFFNPIPLNF